MLRDAVGIWEGAHEKARAQGDEDGQRSADHQRRDYAEQVASLMAFRSGLGRFCRTYAYIAQLIDFGDPALENFAAFAKLLQKRLDGDAPERVDLKGLVLTGFDVKAIREEPGPYGADKPILGPIGPGGGGRAEQPDYLAEIIERINRLFGEVTPLKDQIAFVNQLASIARESDVVMAQVENNSRDQALKGNLPGAVQQGAVRALTSHQKLASLVLKSDRQAMDALTDLIYDLIRENRTLDLEGVDA